MNFGFPKVNGKIIAFAYRPGKVENACLGFKGQPKTGTKIGVVNFVSRIKPLPQPPSAST
jgi:hypothetical protein